MHGLSSNTVGDLRTSLAEEFYPEDANNPGFIPMLNELMERIYVYPGWKGERAWFRLTLNDSKRVILPHFLETINHARPTDCRPVPIFDAPYEFLRNGPGEVDPETSNLGVVIPEDEASAIQNEFPETASQITVTPTVTEDSKEIRLFGLDASGNIIRDSSGVPGESITMTTGDSTSTNTFSKITGIQKELTKGIVTIAAGATTLSTLETYETRPIYKVYKVAEAVTTIDALCLRRRVPLNYEEDYVVPGNTGAIRNLLYSMNYESENEVNLADRYWARGMNILNMEAEREQGGAISVAQFEPHGIDVPPIQNIM